MIERVAAVALAFTILGCSPSASRSPAAPQPAAPATSTPADPAKPADAAAAAGPMKPWNELFADAPPTELKGAGGDEAKWRKLSVDIEVTYRELAKVVQSAPAGCPITDSACSDDWTRYVTTLAAIKQRIDRPTTSCEDRSASPERAHLLDHYDYQSRAYQAHVEKLTADAGTAGAPAFKRLLEAAEKRHSTPACVEPGS